MADLSSPNRIPFIIRPAMVSRSGQLGDLVAGSTPDDKQASGYRGPPIGYSCKKVVHEDDHEEIFGREGGARGIYKVNCLAGGCARCAGYMGSMVSITQLSTPHPPLLVPQVDPPEPAPPPKPAIVPLRIRARGLNASAQPFTHPAIPSKPTKAELKAQLVERQANIEKELEALRAKAAPRASRSSITSRYNHGTGEAFGPRTLNNKKPPQTTTVHQPLLHRRRLALRYGEEITKSFAGAPPPTPASTPPTATTPLLITSTAFQSEPLEYNTDHHRHGSSSSANTRTTADLQFRPPPPRRVGQ